MSVFNFLLLAVIVVTCLYIFVPKVREKMDQVPVIKQVADYIRTKLGK